MCFVCCSSLFLLAQSHTGLLSGHLSEGEVLQDYQSVLHHPFTPDSILGTIKMIISYKMCLASEGDKWHCRTRGVFTDVSRNSEL